MKLKFQTLRAKFLCKKSLSLCFCYADIVLIFILVIHLNDYQYYYHEFLHPYKADKWWEWPTYKTWENNTSNQDQHLSSKNPISPDSTENENLKFPERNEDKEKIILFSYPPFDEIISYPVDEHQCGGKCTVSYDTSLWSKADVVLFHITDPNHMPQRSFSDQLYIWINLESPSTTLLSRHIFFQSRDRAFNMTMTYRRDSDIYFPYNTLYNIRQKIKTTKEVEDLDLLLASKDRLALWVAGNCAYTKGGGTRIRLMLNFLLAGLKLDAFGSCVFRPLPGGWGELPRYARRYKFYFSFENALHCRDYITEKTWGNALLAGAVPVIWGPMKADVEAVLPKGSFIFAEDFDTLTELVHYLNFLDSNMKAYSEYFNWRSEQIPQHIPNRKGHATWMSSEVVGFCQLCHTLHDDDNYANIHGKRPRRVVNSLSDWWYGQETRMCLTRRSNWEIVKAFWHRKLFNQEYYYKSFSHMNYYAPIYLILIIVLVFRRLRFFLKRTTFKTKYCSHL